MNLNRKMFLGCVIPARIPFVEKSARLVFEKLKLEITDLDDASCCPDPTGVPSVSHKTWLAMGARNLSLLENENNTELISLCSGCVETLKMVNHELKEDPKLRKEINGELAIIDKKFEGDVTIKHAGQLLYENLDKIKENITNPLNNFKIGIHYGCHFLRPSEIINWDDPYEPTTLDEIVTILGAESINYESKMECCGNPLMKVDKDLSYKFLYKKLSDMKKTGINCIAVVCPACFLQFDFQQRAINKKYGTEFKFPIFYLTELMAMAFGFNTGNLGFKYHRNRPKKFLREISFVRKE